MTPVKGDFLNGTLDPMPDGDVSEAFLQNNGLNVEIPKVRWAFRVGIGIVYAERSKQSDFLW